MSLIGSIDNPGGYGDSFRQYADLNSDFHEERVGEPILVRLSRGYWIGTQGSGHPDDHSWRLRGVLTEREYHLGIIGVGGMQVEDDSLIIPTQGVVSWQAEGKQRDPSPYPWWSNDPEIGIEWVAAKPTEVTGDVIRVEPTKNVKKTKNARIVNRRVPIHDKGIKLYVEPSTHKKHRQRFAAIEIEPGKTLVKAVLNSEEREDELLARIVNGDITALGQASDLALKKQAKNAAVSGGEEKSSSSS